MRKATLGVITLLLIAFISGCISQTQTVTITETKTHTEYTPITPSTTTTTSTTSTSSPIETSSTMALEEDLIKADCQNEHWRDDYEKAMICGVQEGFNSLFLPEDLGIYTTDELKVPLEFAQYLGNNIYLDVQKENQSMIGGKYFDIKTPFELAVEKNGTYADFAILGAYVFLKRGLDTYIVYAETEKGFGLWPAFRIKENYYDRIFVVYWPYLIPMTLGGAIELLDFAGDPVTKVKIYHLWLDDNHHVKAKLIATEEPGPIIPTYMMPASNDYFDDQGWVKLNLTKKLPQLIQEDNPNCKYVKSSDDIYYRNLKEYEINVPLLLYFYSRPYQDRWVESLAKATYELLKQQGFDPQKCKKFTILDVIPSPYVEGGVYIRIYAEIS
ncbi:hypothetical protein DRN44_01945 [Thermococci archaeon]|nr:MAG: hypothetical protein DRN44_01945 [Thermococci archaeon]